LSIDVHWKEFAMVSTMLKRTVLGTVVLVWMAGMIGCVKQADFDAKVAELKAQSEKTLAAEGQAAEVQKALDAAKAELKQAGETTKEAVEKIGAMEQELSGLKEKGKALEEKAGKAEEQVKKLAGDLEAAKGEAAKVVKEAKDAAAQLDAKFTTLSQENAGLKEHLKKLEQEKADLQKQLSAPKAQ
jgi:chromosome segregation ATPase